MKLPIQVGQEVEYKTGEPDIYRKGRIKSFGGTSPNYRVVVTDAQGEDQYTTLDALREPVPFDPDARPAA